MIEVTDDEMEIPSERLERNAKWLEGAEEGVEVDEAVILDGVNDITEESVYMEEKKVLVEGTGEWGKWRLEAKGREADRGSIACQRGELEPSSTLLTLKG